MRVLLISSDAPVDLDTGSAGIQKRLSLLIEAFGNIAQLDALLYVAPDTDCSSAAVARRELALSTYWNIKINLFLCPKASIETSSSKWRQQTKGIFSLLHQPGFTQTSGIKQVQALEHCLQRQPDAIFVHRLHSMCPVLLTKRPLPPVFFDLDDIEHIKQIRWLKQSVSHPTGWLYYLQIPALCWGEQRAIRQATRTFICSKRDCGYLTQQWRLPNVTVVPNAIAIPKPQPLMPEPTLLLLGTYTYTPNIHAANFLIEQVFPKIQQQVPEAKLIIAGRKPESIRAFAKAPPNVEFTGFVNDLDALYRRSRVACNPIFFGGGTRVKMVEAAAYGKPIVATRIGAEGLEMFPDEDFLLRNTASEFAEGCITLLKNDALCHQLGSSARTKAIQHYDRASIVTLVQQQIQSILKQNLMPANIPTQLNPPVS